MRMIDPLLMEFDREAATTRKVLSRVPANKLSWKPHPKSRTLGELAHHVASIPAWIGRSLEPGGYDLAKGGLQAGEKEATGVESLLATFDDSVSVAKAAIAKLDDARAMGPWTLRHGD